MNLYCPVSPMVDPEPIHSSTTTLGLEHEVGSSSMKIGLDHSI